MSFDLTNKNIKDTIQNLLQRTGSNNQLYDLTGNEIGDIRISGSLIAQQYIVSSSVTNQVIAFNSGSTIFGDDGRDSHQFRGSITASVNISASGYISASKFIGDGSELTGLSEAAISTYNNNGDDRIITSVNSSTVQGEANLTFNAQNQLTKAMNTPSQIAGKYAMPSFDIVHNFMY